MTRDTYDVAEPGPRTPDAADDPAPGPACIHCGGGPLVHVPLLGLTCKSCARVIVTARAHR